ncbi:MAG: universal stress protein [Chloroflexi bacterium]|nr:universal stress protein [Chloroflexota bacterium]
MIDDMSVSVGPNLSSREQEADTYVNKIADRFRRRGITVKTQVSCGDAPYEIKTGAIDWKVDAIVMATRSRQRVQKLVFGSVADVVVRDSRLPVLQVSSRRQRKRRVGKAA